MIEEKRARRIREKERVRAHARFVCQRWGQHGEWLDKSVPRLADNLATCRYGCCQNPRRSPFNKGAARLTMQERRAFQGEP